MLQVDYEDGDEEWVDLGKERFSLTQPQGAGLRATTESIGNEQSCPKLLQLS